MAPRDRLAHKAPQGQLAALAQLDQQGMAQQVRLDPLARPELTEQLDQRDQRVHQARLLAQRGQQERRVQQVLHQQLLVPLGQRAQQAQQDKAGQRAPRQLLLAQRVQLVQPAPPVRHQLLLAQLGQPVTLGAGITESLPQR